MPHLWLIFRQNLGKTKKKLNFPVYFLKHKKKKNQNKTISDRLMIHPIPYAGKSLVFPQPEESVCWTSVVRTSQSKSHLCGLHYIPTCAEEDGHLLLTVSREIFREESICQAEPGPTGWSTSKETGFFSLRSLPDVFCSAASAMAQRVTVNVSWKES